MLQLSVVGSSISSSDQLAELNRKVLRSEVFPQRHRRQLTHVRQDSVLYNTLAYIVQQAGDRTTTNCPDSHGMSALDQPLSTSRCPVLTD
jgi:hypothetical protein